MVMQQFPMISLISLECCSSAEAVISYADEISSTNFVLCHRMQLRNHFCGQLLVILYIATLLLASQ